MAASPAKNKISDMNEEMFRLSLYIQCDTGRSNNNSSNNMNNMMNWNVVIMSNNELDWDRPEHMDSNDRSITMWDRHVCYYGNTTCTWTIESR